MLVSGVQWETNVFEQNNWAQSRNPAKLERGWETSILNSFKEQNYTTDEVLCILFIRDTYNNNDYSNNNFNAPVTANNNNDKNSGEDNAILRRLLK